MAAVSADSVALDVIANVDKADRDVKSYARSVRQSMSDIERAASQAEAAIVQGAERKARAEERAAERIKRAAEKAANASAAGQRNFARQIADIGTGLAGGQSPFLILAQQAPQVADALADTGGKAAAVARFFAGPWGAAMLAAASIVGTTLIPKLLEGGDAADTMSKAQADLFNYVDRATGAINLQTVAIQRLAAAQSRQTDIEAQARTHATARGTAINAVRDAAGVADPTPVYTAGGATIASQAPIADPIKQRLRDLAAEAVKTGRSMNDFALDVRNAVGDRPEYRDLVKTVTAQASAAVTAAKSVEHLRAEQALLSGTATDAQKALLGFGLATTGLVEKQVALATATTAVEKARAKLALVEEKGRGIAAGDAKALAQYRTELTGANNALHVAEAAEKAAAEAKREHSKETRDAKKLQSELAAIERAFDPAAEAAREYAKALRDIQALQSAGLISPDTAETYSNAARMARFAANDAIDKKKNDRTDAAIAAILDRPGGISDSVKRSDDDIRNRAEDRMKLEFAVNEKLAADQAEKIQSLASLYETAFLGGSDAIWDTFKREGIKAIALLLAKFTVLQMTSGGSIFGNLSSAASSVFGGGGGGGLFKSLLGGVSSLLGGGGGFTPDAINWGGIAAPQTGPWSEIPLPTGRASGGRVAAGQLVRINEGASPGRVEGWRPQGSGEVIPLGRMNAVSARGGTVLHQTVNIDASGVNPEGYTKGILGIVRRETAQALDSNNAQNRRGFPALQARFNKLGTTG